MIWDCCACALVAPHSKQKKGVDIKPIADPLDHQNRSSWATPNNCSVPISGDHQQVELRCYSLPTKDGIPRRTPVLVSYRRLKIEGYIICGDQWIPGRRSIE
jgi:hypothetical protein